MNLFPLLDSYQNGCQKGTSFYLKTFVFLLNYLITTEKEFVACNLHNSEFL